MHHGDAKLAGHERVGRLNPPAIELNFAFVRGVNAGENLSECAFARAVFANEGMATAVVDVEADTIKRQHAGEAFGDLAEGEEGHLMPTKRERHETSLPPALVWPG